MSQVNRGKIEEYVAKGLGQIDPASKHYVALFDSYYINQQKKWFMEWNWYAFILGPVWMAYRGMFWVAAALVVFVQALNYLNFHLFLVGTLFVWVLIGFYGNALYLSHIERWIKNDVVVKKGVDLNMAILVFILFACRIVIRLST